MRQRKGRPDPFADYVEWSNNRYNPGYYLGGNIPPYLRKSSLGPRARHRMGIALTISACISAGVLLVTVPWPGSDWMSLILEAAGVALTAWAAIAMFRSSQRKQQPPRSRRRPPSR